jgi:catechol 2,3-dioxygenase-like lactoylglutathione lyase family enzyme
MDMKFELVPVPVADLDRAKAFYSEKLGFVVDHDTSPVSGIRIIQLTPPGSACSIVISTGLSGIDAMTPGSLKALHLVVKDAVKAREMLVERGVEVSGVDEHPQGIKFVHFSDPDGNTWLFQEMPWRSGDFKD